MQYGISAAHKVHRTYSSQMGKSHCGSVKVSKLTSAGPRAVALHLKQFPDCMCRSCFDGGYIPKEVRDLMQES